MKIFEGEMSRWTIPRHCPFSWLEKATPAAPASGAAPGSAAKAKLRPEAATAPEFGSRRRRWAWLLAGGATAVTFVVLALGMALSGSREQDEQARAQPAPRLDEPPAAPAKPTSVPPVDPEPPPDASGDRQEEASSPPPARATATEEEKGFLSVLCAPRWCDVTIDGKNRGYSPVMAVPLQAGTHLVKVVNPETQMEMQERVRVQPKRTETVKFKMH